MFLIDIAAPNTGLILRFQQIWAMFVKKFYISIRAYGFLISQVLFPAFFIILGNVLAITGLRGTDQGQDPQRTLTLENSALFVDNVTVFYVQFGHLNIQNSSESFFLSVSELRLKTLIEVISFSFL